MEFLLSFLRRGRLLSGFYRELSIRHQYGVLLSFLGRGRLLSGFYKDLSSNVAPFPCLVFFFFLAEALSREKMKCFIKRSDGRPLSILSGSKIEQGRLLLPPIYRNRTFYRVIRSRNHVTKRILY